MSHRAAMVQRRGRGQGRWLRRAGASHGAGCCKSERPPLQTRRLSTLKTARSVTSPLPGIPKSSTSPTSTLYSVTTLRVALLQDVGSSGQSLFPLRAWTSRPSLSTFSKWGSDWGLGPLGLSWRAWTPNRTPPF